MRVCNILRRWKQENREFRVILSCIRRARPVLSQIYMYIYIFYVIVMKGPKFSRLLKASVTDVAPGTSGPGRCLPLPRILAYGKPFLHRNLAPVLWSR